MGHTVGDPADGGCAVGCALAVRAQALSWCTGLDAVHRIRRTADSMPYGLQVHVLRTARITMAGKVLQRGVARFVVSMRVIRRRSRAAVAYTQCMPAHARPRCDRYDRRPPARIAGHGDTCHDAA